MADILIAGGGVAGSSLAILLGRRGFDVELHERGAFPREKACGEGLMPAGVAVLERMGLVFAPDRRLLRNAGIFREGQPVRLIDCPQVTRRAL